MLTFPKVTPEKKGSVSLSPCLLLFLSLSLSLFVFLSQLRSLTIKQGSIAVEYGVDIGEVASKVWQRKL